MNARITKSAAALAVVALALAIAAPRAHAQNPTSVIFGDDVGPSNISAYTMGLMGHRTPNIDQSPTMGPASSAGRGRSRRDRSRTRS